MISSPLRFLSGILLGVLHLISSAATACNYAFIFWAGAMVLFETSHLRTDRPLGCILIPHLTAFSVVSASGLYQWGFTGSVIHPLSDGVLGIHLILLGLGISFTGSVIHPLSDGVLGIHLILLGLGAALLVLKAMSYGDLYDPWSPGGGDVRISDPIFNPMWRQGMFVIPFMSRLGNPFTFLVRDQRLGASVAKAQAPTGLGKDLMRSPSGDIILGRETMRFWDLRAPWLEPCRAPNGLDISKLRSNIQPWQERRASEFMTHAPLGSLNRVGGVAAEMNGVNYVSPRAGFRPRTSAWYFWTYKARRTSSGSDCRK